MTNGLLTDKRGVVGWMGLLRRQSTITNSSDIYDIVRNLLSRVIPNTPMEDCGSGKEGLRMVISKLSGAGGVYIFLNTINKKIYVGSSLNMSRRMREYKDGGIHNSNLSKDIERYGWGVFKIIVIRIPGGIKLLHKWEYKIMNLIRDSGLGKLYNRFRAEEDRKRYERLKGRGGRDLYGMIFGERKRRENMRRVAKERGYGERIKEYRFKKGEENIKAIKIKVWDTKTGLEYTGILKEVAELMSGSVRGIRYALKKGTRYKGRYELTLLNIKEKAVKPQMKEEGSRGKGGQFLKGKMNINYKEVRLEDLKTGEVRIVPQSEVADKIGGSKRGVIRAIKEGKKYKGRYIIRNIEKEES